MRRFFLLISIVFVQTIKGQENNPDVPNVLEVIPEKVTQAQFEILEDFKIHPININTCDLETLSELPFLNFDQVRNFLMYRLQVGSLLSESELYGIPLWDSLTVSTISAYIEVKPASNRPFLSRLQSKDGLSSFFAFKYKSDLQPFDTAGLGEERMLNGHPAGRVVRLKIRKNNVFDFGFTGDLDAGESFKIANNQLGFDHTAIYLNAYDLLKTDQLTVGNFNLTTGQGLLFGGMGFSQKGALIHSTTSSGFSNFRASGSTMEWGYLKGIAAQKKIGNFAVGAFYSQTNKDSTNSPTGYHRNLAESRTRKRVKEKIAGAIVDFHWQHRLFATLASKFYLDSNNWDKNGLSFSYNYLGKHLTTFGEFLVQKNQSLGSITGLTSRWSSQFKTLTMVRYFSPGLVSNHSNVLSENSRAENEFGFYNGFEWKVAKGMNLSGYFDWFKFPEPQHRMTYGGQGNEILFRIHKLFENRSILLVQAKQEIKTQDVAGEQQVFDYKYSENRHRIQMFTQYRWKSTASVKHTIRFQYQQQKHYQKSTDGGAAFFETAIKRARAQGVFRVTAFHTPKGYPIYFYERDVQYSFSVPALSGTGTRIGAFFSFKPTSFIKAQLNFTHTTYRDKTSISQHPTKILGNQRTTLTALLAMNF
jgi:hypothetical protein